jgi:hypothetical protein
VPFDQQTGRRAITPAAAPLFAHYLIAVHPIYDSRSSGAHLSNDLASFYFEFERMRLHSSDPEI